MFRLAIVAAFFLMSVRAYPQPDEDIPQPPLAPWEKCKDKWPGKCATDDWKERCDVPAHKVFMARNCADTCKLCDDSINTEIVDCKWSDWKAEGSCSKSCGTGEQVFTRKIEVLAENGGRDCGTFFRKTAICNEKPCPSKLDCVWNRWSESGPCSKSCGTGQQLYLRSHLREAQNGGEPCPGLSHKMEPCNEIPC